MIGDDHANPSIIVLKNQTGRHAVHNGKLLVAAAEHGTGVSGRGRLQVRRSIEPYKIDQWEPSIELRDTRATYSSLFQTIDGTIYLFCRLSRTAPNSRATFYYWISNDAGQKWSQPQLLIDANEGTDDAIYLVASSDLKNNSLHIGINRMDYDNPVDGVWRYRDLYYLRLDTVTQKGYKADGTSIGSPPFYLNELEQVYITQSDVGKEDWTYISDIKDSSQGPRIVSITDYGRGSADALPCDRTILVLYHYFSNGSWYTETVGQSATFHYVCMASLFEGYQPKVLGFVPGKGGGSIPTIFKRENECWQIDEQFNISKNNVYHARPFISQPDGKGLFAIWSVIEDYHASPYTEWKSRIIGAVKY